jgi:hypothetical protein
MIVKWRAAPQNADFWEKKMIFFVKIWPLHQILWKFKNAFICFFLWSNRLFVPIFGQIGHAVSKQQSKTWFRGKFCKNLTFDLYLWGQFCKISKTPLRACFYGQVAWLCQFCHNRLNRICRFRMTSQNVIFWFCSLLLTKILPLPVRSILRNFKNAVTGLFLGSSCLVVPILSNPYLHDLLPWKMISFFSKYIFFSFSNAVFF